jgi:ATP-dependent RNA helicase RhlE
MCTSAAPRPIWASAGAIRPTPVQSQAIPAVLAGRDVMAAAQTGTGKTAGFALPLLQRLTMKGPGGSQRVRALVLVPTRELAEQVHTSFKAYGAGLPLRTMVAYGGVSINPQMMKPAQGSRPAGGHARAACSTCSARMP